MRRFQLGNRQKIVGPGHDGTVRRLSIEPQRRDAVSLAAEIIRKVNREHPADHVLRETLRVARMKEQPVDAEVARAVFGYYRWYGWLDQESSLVQRIRQAASLREQFVLKSQAFPDQQLVKRAVPAWIRREMEVRPAWARALQTEPKLWLRARSGRGKTLAESLSQCRTFGAGRLADTLEYEGPLDLFRTEPFHAGEFEVQDISSQAVSLICAPRPGETWWDACAGEGGKTLHLSDLMQNKGLIWATDRSKWRLQLLKRRAGRAKVFNYRAALWDGERKLPTRTKFDGVLVDAPCSGVGTWHRNPHARWTTTLEDVAELAAVQEQLLLRVAAAVKPGGRLVYAVCTLTRAETTGVVDKFEAANSEFEPLPILSPLKLGAPPQERVFLWPQEFGGNGMFVAEWKRRA
jgi:16S rRNA (cytosine967-C5)-methyltransferase